MSLETLRITTVFTLVISLAGAYAVAFWTVRTHHTALLRRYEQRLDQLLREGEYASSQLKAQQHKIYATLYKKFYRAYRTSLTVVRNAVPFASLTPQGYIEETLRTVGASKKEIAKILDREHSLSGEQAIIHELNALYIDCLHRQCKRHYQHAVDFFLANELFLPDSVVQAIENLEALLNPIVLKMPGQPTLQESQLTSQMRLIRHLLSETPHPPTSSETLSQP
ncbi:MAG: hypothetical protein OWR62_03860 [Sulfobacillus thermotolerans]|uniref:Uncharacterized protein n=1 Tax=Sulfobacillus thermotolerans TaxID=338644 RepID=A0ABM6RQ77_9FIRM|nr:hypothetical protein BXT84_05430 [Sulfobacillus thermotolerans]MCY0907508.1 hypothetical protein [Sulfobacillus thermotolerans]